MSDEQIAPFLKAFDDADADGSGECDQEEFKSLFQKVMGKDDPEAADLYFRGIDIDNSGSISRDEFKNFVSAALNKDQDYTIKLVFRAFDKDHSRTLDATEIKAIGKYVNRDLSDEEISEVAKRQTGDPNSPLNFAQIVKLLLKKDIPDDTDPYDGKIPPSPPKTGGAAADPAATPAPQPEAKPAASAAGGAAADPKAGKSSCCLLL
jgi:Ca2+-binding EF-hand superfamily protein